MHGLLRSTVAIVCAYVGLPLEFQFLFTLLSHSLRDLSQDLLPPWWSSCTDKHSKHPNTQSPAPLGVFQSHDSWVNLPGDRRGPRLLGGLWYPASSRDTHSDQSCSLGQTEAHNCIIKEQESRRMFDTMIFIIMFFILWCQNHSSDLESVTPFKIETNCERSEKKKKTWATRLKNLILETYFFTFFYVKKIIHCM